MNRDQNLHQEAFVWFVYKNETQYGPFSESEIHVLVRTGSLLKEHFLWKQGWANWVLAGDVLEIQDDWKTEDRTIESSPPAFLEDPGPIQIAEKNSVERRRDPRSFFSAQVRMTDGKRILVGLSEDISQSGAWIKVDGNGLRNGMHFRMNFSPLDMSDQSFVPFVATGRVTRVSDNLREGCAIEFDHLNQSAKESISIYAKKIILE